MNIKKNIISLFMSVIIIACCSNSLNAATINKATANKQYHAFAKCQIIAKRWCKYILFIK